MCKFATKCLEYNPNYYCCQVVTNKHPNCMQYSFFLQKTKLYRLKRQLIPQTKADWCIFGFSWGFVAGVMFVAIVI